MSKKKKIHMCVNFKINKDKTHILSTVLMENYQKLSSFFIWQKFDMANVRVYLSIEKQFS